VIDLVRRSPSGRVVNMSSAVSSNTLWGDPQSELRRFTTPLLAYNTSKAALNSVTVQYAAEFYDTAVKINAAAPGYTATDANQHQGHLAVTDEESVAVVIKLATLPDDGPTGEFHDIKGPIPW
jgi:NAD(P)-dependent dehydrogenase (short-subunit alcohol dehydrogenase family)